MSPLHDNGIPCTCIESRDGCRSSIHKPVPLPCEKFVDKNGRKILHGDTLRYVNPNHPDRKQPLHRALIMDGDCFVQPDGGEPHRARSRGRWVAERFEIVPTP